MPLGTEIGLGAGDIMLGREQAPSPCTERKQKSPSFWPTLLFWDGRPSQQLLSSCYLNSSIDLYAVWDTETGGSREHGGVDARAKKGTFRVSAQLKSIVKHRISGVV